MLAFKYQLIRSSRRRKTSSIAITPQGEVLVTAPQWVTTSQINKFVTSKKSWIEKKLTHVNNLLKKYPQKKYLHGEKHLYFGEEYPLNIKYSSKYIRPQIEFLYNKFNARIHTHHSPEKQQQDTQKALIKWYLENGRRIITHKAQHFCQLLNTSYNKVTIKKVSSIWGSCSARGNLNFNRKLIMAPHKVVDYVVLHEACHLIHRHHKKSFWDLVASLDPNYQAHKLWLRKHHHILYI